MKNKLLIVAIFVLAITLGACSAESTKADAPNGFILISEDENTMGDYITVYQHIETGCYYTTMAGDYDSAVAITQMFINVDGVSLPYCKFYSQ